MYKAMQKAYCTVACLTPEHLSACIRPAISDLCRLTTGGIQWSGIVMIAPPNQGSVVARQMSSLPGMGKLFQ